MADSFKLDVLELNSNDENWITDMLEKCIPSWWEKNLGRLIMIVRDRYKFNEELLHYKDWEYFYETKFETPFELLAKHTKITLSFDNKLDGGLLFIVTHGAYDFEYAHVYCGFNRLPNLPLKWIESYNDYKVSMPILRASFM